MYKLATVFAVAFIAFGSPVNAQQFPASKGCVTDHAQVMQPATVAQLEKELAQHTADGKPAVVLVTVSSLEGHTIEAYATNLFSRWEIGDPQKNDGVLLLVAPTERKARIVLGRGINTHASRQLAAAVMSTLVDAIKADKLDDGVAAATRDLMRQEWVTTPTREEQQRQMLYALLFIAAVAVIVIVVSWVYTRYENRRLCRAWLAEIHSSLERVRPRLQAEGVKVERSAAFKQHERTYGEWRAACAGKTNWKVARAAIHTLRYDVQSLEWQVSNDLRLVADAKAKLPQLLAQLPQTLSDAQSRIDAAGDSARARRAREKLRQARLHSDQASTTNNVGDLSTAELVALYVIVRNAYDSCAAADDALNPPTHSYGVDGGVAGASDCGGGDGVTGAW